MASDNNRVSPLQISAEVSLCNGLLHCSHRDHTMYSK